MNGKIPQSQAELEAHLQDHIGFLEASAASFDAGIEGEAKRLAVSLRVLLHDTKNSHSLLAQLGRKNGVFVDTAHDFDPANVMSHCGLVVITMGPGLNYGAPLDDTPFPPKSATFDEWWSKIVFVDKVRRPLTRRDIILAVANKDGGAHVDPALDAVYAGLTRKNSLGWVAVSNEGTRSLEGPERAAVRQISYEVLKSLKPGYAAKPAAHHGITIAGVSLIQGPPPPGFLAKTSGSPGAQRKMERNERCYCGSGKKFKRCHGQR